MKAGDLYKCDLCGNVVSVSFSGGGALQCCNNEMVLLKANATDAAQEKHVPVIEKGEGTVTVKVGSVAHPMTDDHIIVFIELWADGVAYRKPLQAGDAPEATFAVTADVVEARAYCNKHGLWKNA